MLPDIAAHAFELFFTTRERGTGLGLSQVYGFAKQSGGTATIDSAVGRGTTVTMYLPMVEKEAFGETVSSAWHANPLQGLGRSLRRVRGQPYSLAYRLILIRPPRGPSFMPDG